MCASTSSFGDIVNWDFLPDNAIEGITILGANPVYGLNALGGAVSILMRDGFNFQGVESDTRFGSFGHKEEQLTLGARSGNWAAFFAGQVIDDDGFRDFSDAQVRRMYADLGVKNDGAEFHLNFTGADNQVGVTAAAPVQLLDLGWDRTFTSPQITDNRMSMVSLNGSVKATPSLTFSGVGYYRWFQREHVDGNVADAQRCGSTVSGQVAPPGVRVLCFEDDDFVENVVRDQNGKPIPGTASGPLRFVNGIDIRDTRHARPHEPECEWLRWKLAGRGQDPNRRHAEPIPARGSYDHGSVAYSASSELGFFGPLFVVNSFNPPIYLTAPSDVRPRIIDTTNDYVGVYFTDTLDVTKALSLTVGGRYNFARIDIQNENPDPATGDLLSGAHTYERFNPMAGATYELLPGLTLYGGYSEANRAPTAAELACADPVNPCLIESFLTADPNLKQVVSRTFELGLRGKLASLGNDQRLEWTAGLFRTKNQDDIITVASTDSGRGFFQNAGNTLRQGIELGAQYQNREWYLYANYAFIDATFETANVLSSPNNPAGFICPGTDPADGALCIQVNPGDRLPGVPRHRFKAGFDYWLTSQWKFGADLIAASDQVFFGDESNQNAPLPGYTTVNLHTSYDVTKNIQIYGLVDNVFDAHYGLFGNFFSLGDANNAARADPSTGANFFSDPRTITPAAPVAAYGGIKVKF